MANGITWVHSAKSGYVPCDDFNAVEKFRKEGFEVLEVKPSAHKAKSSVEIEKAALATKPPFAYPKQAEEPKELSKEELVELAADSGIAIDKRWNAQRIKEALDL